MKYLLFAALLLLPASAPAQDVSETLFVTHRQFAACLVHSAFARPQSIEAMVGGDCGDKLLAWCAVIPQWNAERCFREGMSDAYAVLNKMER